MKNIYSHSKSLLHKLWNDESGQGTAEYVLLIAMVAGAFMVFKKPIMDWFNKSVGDVTGKLDNALQ
jgi:Flp pilus assembly pilin Flp